MFNLIAFFFSEPLDKPEEFLLQIHKMDHFAERLECWLYRNKFTETITAIGKTCLFVPYFYGEFYWYDGGRRGGCGRLGRAAFATVDTCFSLRRLIVACFQKSFLSAKETDVCEVPLINMVR